MGNPLKIYIGLLVLLLSAIALIEARKPKAIDWSPTFSINDKSPFGLYVLHNEIDSVLKADVSRINITPYEFLDPLYNYDSVVNSYMVNGTFIDISETDNLDSQSLSEIFHFVGHGNTALLSMKSYPAALLDSLNLEMQYDYEFTDTIQTWLTNPDLNNRKYNVVRGAGNSYFTKTDSLTTDILGYQSGETPRSNFIRVNYRNGQFLLHTQPSIFTNYYLLKDVSSDYAAGVLSYIPPDDNILWYTRDAITEQISNSQMRYILSQPALRSAWYLFLMGMLIFMLFNARRKQRIMPVIVPLANTTIAFTKTIANLYYQEGDFDTIIDKKIIYLLERLRTDHLIDTTVLDQDFARKLAQKSGKDPAMINNVINRINQHRNSRHTSVESDLVEINNAIENIISWKTI